MNKKNKVIAIALAGVLAASVPTVFTACAPRDQVLKIYNWGDYIDEDLLPEFEEWYFRETGKNITVQYDTFDTNESMIMRIEVLKSDYDLVCPSDYMAERMIQGGLVQKIDREIFDVTDDFLYGNLAEMIQPFDPNNEYYVPYVWGTFGIMYDTKYIAPKSEDMKYWAAMWDKKYAKHILMKDSVRDAYSVASIYNKRDALYQYSNGYTDYSSAEYKAAVKSIFSEINNSAIAAAQSTLISQKSLLYKYEVDDGKNDMLAGTTDAWLGLFWSCDSALIMIEEGGEHFYYEVPKEGSNVWVDGWLIPTTAGNPSAANYFLKFINTYDDDNDFAMRNFDYMGSSMASKAVMDDAKEYYTYIMNNELTDEEKAEMDEEEIEFAEMMYGRDEWFKQMYLDMLFPPEDVLARCGVMRDFGKAWSTELDSMWIDVKTT